MSATFSPYTSTITNVTQPLYNISINKMYDYVTSHFRQNIACFFIRFSNENSLKQSQINITSALPSMSTV